MKKILACLALVIWSQQALAEARMVFGSTDAQRCFQESQLVLSGSGLQYCNDAIKSGDLNRRDLAATYSNRGVIYVGIGELDRALADQMKAIDLVPTLAQAYINRGNVYHHMKDYEKAFADYRRAVALESGPRAIPHYNAGLTLLRMKRNDEALAAFKKALEFSPDSKAINERIEYLEELKEEASEQG